jgi:hypothetical protein
MTCQMSGSDSVDIKCRRCALPISPDRSAFCVVLVSRSSGSKVSADVIYSRNLRYNDIAVHANGDRSCGKRSSGFRKILIEALGLSEEIDISWIDLI